MARVRLPVPSTLSPPSRAWTPPRPAGSPSALAALVVGGLLAGTLPARPAAAQTPTTAIGLGYPVPAVDARAAALGGTRTGLLGGSFGTPSPADLTEFTNAALSVTAAPEVAEIRTDGLSGDRGRSRFTVIRAVVPVEGVVVSAGVRSELDQDWAFVFEDTLSTSQGDFPFEERRESDGGLGSLELAAARSFGPVSVGIGVDRMTGSLRQLFSRRFEISVDSMVEAPARVEEDARWAYEGWRFRAGVGVRLAERLRVSGAWVWSGDLTAERDTVDERRTFSMPSGFEVGASFRPGEDWIVAGSAGWTGWSDLDGQLGGDGARDAFRGGGGVEYRGLTVGAFPVHLRGGGRYVELPFSLAGEEAATEGAVTLGLGTRFAQNRASLDVALEMGSRGDAPSTGVEESFRRFVFTASVRP